MNLVEIKRNGTHEKVCTMPLWVWKLTEPRKPLGFLGGYIIRSYQTDPENKKCGLWHLWDALRVWRWARKGVIGK